MRPELIKMRIALKMVFFIGIFLTKTAEAQDKGKQIFEKNCIICHKLTDEKLVGPGLKGVTTRHDKAWLKKFITASQDFIKSGDKTAIEAFNANGKIPMPNHTFLTDDDLNQLIEYIGNYKPPETRKVNVDVSKKDHFDREDVLRGERLFAGVIPFEKGPTLNCLSCHATIATDSLNFNPSAYDLAKAWLEPGGTDLYQVLNMPTSPKMAVVHKDLELSDKEIYDISAYLWSVSKKGMVWEKIFPARLFLFILAGILMALALADLIWFHKVKYRFIHVLVLAAGAVVHTTLVVQEGINLSRTKNYMPDQPIKFSHKVHAGQNQIDCKYCHSISPVSKSAGIPSSNLCMNCHLVVTQGSRSGKFEITKIYRAIQSGKSIPWVRIHNLPDYVYFSHAQHVTVAKVKCQECHGHVEQMDLMKQASDLSMGWCVNCHRHTGVQFTDNNYYKTYKSLYEQVKSGKLKRITAERLGGIDCAKCHY